MCYNSGMKKTLIIFCALTMLCCMLSGCNKAEGTDYSVYFNNFGSAPGIAQVTEGLDLGEDIFVSSYDKTAAVYITQKQIVIEGDDDEDDTVYNLFGFATGDEIIFDPKYANVIDVRYNFAIVAKRVAEGASTRTTIGMVKLRGDYVGREYGFSYEYTGVSTQYSFLNDTYMVMLGDKTYTSTTSSFATVYDYTSANGLLEVGRIGNTTYATTFALYDNYIAAVGMSIVRYYFFDKIDGTGYFELSNNGKYIPFKEEDGFTDITLVTTSVFYIANGWFIETGIYRSTTEFTGYEQIQTDDDTTYYFVNKSTRYNVRSGKRFTTDRVKLVANRYSLEYTESLANTLNYDVGIFTEDKMPLYYQPVMPVSALVKDGYSLVYYDFYFYDEEDNAQWGQTFSIYDQNAEVTNLKDFVMPLLVIDGLGLQNSDPVFGISVRDFGYNKLDGSDVILLALESTLWYDPVILNDGMLVGYCANLASGEESNMMGAASTDGSSIIPFAFVELTTFVGGYATGSKIQMDTDGNFEKRVFYRVSKSGVLTELENVYSLRNGVYITKENDKYGLMSNDGTRLLDAQYDSLSVIDNFLTDGVYFVSHVVGIKDGHGMIFDVSAKI